MYFTKISFRINNAFTPKLADKKLIFFVKVLVFYIMFVLILMSWHKRNEIFKKARKIEKFF
ncbi:hypothetical protein SCLARK_00748 [Spiroplasma clarkii]|nr:hypothetical protein SCLARK_00748 [Spiroplasma clarkii]